MEKGTDIDTKETEVITENVEEVKEFVEALWDAHGNVSKASQKLFLHRNTLQYRIDRFAEQTGLNVKDMNDLTLCHLLLQKQSY